MAASPCARCGGTRWIRYFSETMDGDFEEAFRLCECNYKLQEGYGERPWVRLERVEIALRAGRLRLVTHDMTFEISVEPNPLCDSGDAAVTKLR